MSMLQYLKQNKEGFSDHIEVIFHANREVKMARKACQSVSIAFWSLSVSNSRTEIKPMHAWMTITAVTLHASNPWFAYLHSLYKVSSDSSHINCMSIIVAIVMYIGIAAIACVAAQ